MRGEERERGGEGEREGRKRGREEEKEREMREADRERTLESLSYVHCEHTAGKVDIASESNQL